MTEKTIICPIISQMGNRDRKKSSDLFKVTLGCCSKTGELETWTWFENSHKGNFLTGSAGILQSWTSTTMVFKWENQQLPKQFWLQLCWTAPGTPLCSCPHWAGAHKQRPRNLESKATSLKGGSSGCAASGTWMREAVYTSKQSTVSVVYGG